VPDGHRFPREAIAHAVRLYLPFALSFRDVRAGPRCDAVRQPRGAGAPTDPRAGAGDASVHVGGVGSVASAHRFLEAFNRVGNLFRPRRHSLRAAAYRAVMRAATWRHVARLQAAGARRR
jgi:hypothetical protein